MEIKKSESNKRRLKGNKHTRISSGLFLSPSLIGVVTFFIAPFLVVIYYASVDNPINKELVYFDNIIRVFKNSSFQLAALNTLKFSLIAVPLVVILSLAFAFLLDMNIPKKSLARTFLLSPMMVPIASVVLIWQVLFHYNGVANEALKVIGVDKIDWFKSDYAIVVIVLLFVWKNLGYNMILFMAALSNLPKEILEVAEVESASRWQIFYHIKVRYLSSTILFVTILSVINSFKVFREVYMLSGDYPYDSLYMLQHFMNNTFRSLDYQKLSAAAIIMSIAMITIIGFLFVTESQIGKDIEG